MKNIKNNINNNKKTKNIAYDDCFDIDDESNVDNNNVNNPNNNKEALKLATKKNKSNFIHWDLEAFDVINGEEQEKDTVLMNAIPYIMSGDKTLID